MQEVLVTSGSQAREAAPGTLAQVGDQAATLIPRQCWPRLREGTGLALGARDVLRLQIRRRPRLVLKLPGSPGIPTVFKAEKIDGFANQLDLVNSESSMILFTFIVSHENALAF